MADRVKSNGDLSVESQEECDNETLKMARLLLFHAIQLHYVL